MKGLHIWNRRDFSVASAGYFTVLKPAGWFAASRLSGGFRYLGGQPEETAPESTSAPKQKAPYRASTEETAPRLQTIERNTHDHPLMRPALVVLGATAITSVLLWWIAFPRLH